MRKLQMRRNGIIAVAAGVVLVAVASLDAPSAASRSANACPQATGQQMADQRAALATAQDAGQEIAQMAVSGDAAGEVEHAVQEPLPGPPRRQKLPVETELNPATLAYKLPSQIHWVDDAIGAKTAVLLGDPSKPGLYIVLVKWTPHHMSHPHWHPNNRYITVISGTWWVGTGTKFDPNRTVAMPAGSFVTHFAKQVHYDGAKDQEAVLEIVGEGPATATPAEVK